jgi:thioredoxin 1
MDLHFPAGKKTAFVTALLAVPVLFVGCTNLGTGATTASGPSSGLSHARAALFDAPVTSADPGNQELNEDPAPVIQEPARAEPVSFHAKQASVKQDTKHQGDVKKQDVKKQTAPRRVEHVNDQSFEQAVLDSDDAVLVDFYADWCAPCKRLSPVLDELAQETPDVRIVKVNIDRSPESAKSYQVKSIPTLILFKGGRPVARRGGLLNKDSLKKLVSQQ